jgi:hypothetical protein
MIAAEEAARMKKVTIRVRVRYGKWEMRIDGDGYKPAAFPPGMGFREVAESIRLSRPGWDVTVIYPGKWVAWRERG